MTPEQKIKYLILLKVAAWEDKPLKTAVTADNIDDLYRDIEEPQDARSEIRSSGVDTGLPCEYSRHYETKAVAAKMLDGSWVGWTYYYGGGKHSEPDAIDWMDDAYDLDCQEEEKVVTVRTFTRQEKSA